MLPFALKTINTIAPIIPITMPVIFVEEKCCLKNATAIIKVNSGVRELSTPAVELESLVCAFANRMAGRPFPNKPTKVMRSKNLTGTL